MRGRSIFGMLGRRGPGAKGLVGHTSNLPRLASGCSTVRNLSGLIRTDDPSSLRRLGSGAGLLDGDSVRVPPLEADPSGVSKADPEDVIDMPTMYDPSIHLPDKPDFAAQSSKYEAATPLSDALIARIGVTGPITMAEYMRQALRHPSFGYYTRKRPAAGRVEEEEEDDWDYSPQVEEQASIIGADGDFITAPEISQVFGECILVWLVHLWEVHLCKAPAIRIVELGPGRGTLIADITAAAMRAFPSFASAIAHVHLVEVSHPLRHHQRASLQAVVDARKASPRAPTYRFVFEPCDDQHFTTAEDSTAHSIPVSWHDHLSSVPVHDALGSPVPTFFIGQEVLDALPVHSFQRTAQGHWRERLVDVATTAQDGDAQGDLTLGETSRARRRYVEEPVELPPDAQITHKLPRLRFVLPPDTTPALRTLLNVDKQGRLSPSPAAEEEGEAAEGDVIEVCPEGLVLVQDVASRIDDCGGAALFIDYGYSGGGGDTLRAFHKHKQVHVLSSPGMVDVTADVDFHALKQAVNSGMSKLRALKRQDINREHHDNQSFEEITTERTSEAIAFGPITQGEFLASMGATERVIQAVEDPSTTVEQAEALVGALERLISHESPHMGARYKVLAIAPKKDGIFGPPGFS